MPACRQGQALGELLAVFVVSVVGEQNAQERRDAAVEDAGGFLDEVSTAFAWECVYSHRSEAPQDWQTVIDVELLTGVLEELERLRWGRV